MVIHTYSHLDILLLDCDDYHCCVGSVRLIRVICVFLRVVGKTDVLRSLGDIFRRGWHLGKAQPCHLTK